MLPFGMWSVGRILLLAFGWLVLVPLATIVWFLAVSALSQASGAGAAGIGAVSVGFSVPVVILVWFGPVLLLFGIWLAAKFVS